MTDGALGDPYGRRLACSDDRTESDIAPCQHGRMSPVPGTLLWLSVAAALTQALTTHIHIRDNRTPGASDRQREIPNRMVLLGLTVSVFAAVRAVLASLLLERGDFGVSPSPRCARNWTPHSSASSSSFSTWLPESLSGL